ncbi:hypothetical protein I316_04449 [Kwoniella heveanensis BCC8398]|uniref:Uncharacterized protein n=1 Tax=Kwoniella heveanensis BCC8398 TaxID=1296120 RepID=A0A1B9GRW8_9TREE|nr:hypothetical protein I316_04449 [Kwoniella heveanensis BCC8398]
MAPPLMTEVIYLNDRRYPGPTYHPASEDIAGLPTQEELDAYPRMFTWGELKQTIVDGRLENLMRNKEMQARYNSWTKGIKERFGSTEKYLTQSRLPFPRSSDPHTEPTYDPDALDGGPSSPKARSRPPLPDSSNSPKIDARHAQQSRQSGPRPGTDYLSYDAEEGFDESKYAVLNNDWPYNIPPGVRHFCVWSRVPIAHPSLVDDDPGAWAKIEEEGLGGFTGILPISTPARPSIDPSCLPSIPTQASALSGIDTSSSSHKGSDALGHQGPSSMRHPLGWGAVTLSEFGEQDWYAVDLKFGGPELQKWANRQYEAKGGQEVGKMVKALWDERGWECLWFVNPPRLQSVPGLSHFHVFARRKTPEEIDAGERIWGKSEA